MRTFGTHMRLIRLMVTLVTTAGVAEMLLQSYNDKLVILPALPTSFWQKGSVKGLKAVGNFTVDIDWDNAKATQIRVVSNEGIPCVVKYTGIAKDYKVTTTDGNAVAATRISDDEISFPNREGRCLSSCS